MLRGCARRLQRTSPHGPGSWSTPTVEAPALHNSKKTGDGRLKRQFGVESVSMIKREQMTLTRLLKVGMDATFQPKDQDSRAFGGDGATQRASLYEELKYFDKRIQPYAHDEILQNFLKSITALDGPTGRQLDPEMLRGRIVGLLFFTESERSMQFMRKLKVFHDRHRPDFVVVAVSLAGKEMMDLTHRFGFFHCTHRNGATWVQRDAGVNVTPLIPLPRLVIVEGSNGCEITRSGVTAVVARPETCFAAWRRGDPGYEWHDYRHAFYL